MSKCEREHWHAGVLHLHTPRSQPCPSSPPQTRCPPSLNPFHTLNLRVSSSARLAPVDFAHVFVSPLHPLTNCKSKRFSGEQCPENAPRHVRLPARRARLAATKRRRQSGLICDVVSNVFACERRCVGDMRSDAHACFSRSSRTSDHETARWQSLGTWAAPPDAVIPSDYHCPCRLINRSALTSEKCTS